MKYFIGHAHEDARTASELSLKLRKRGHNTFVDADDLPPGGDYDARIKRAIQESDGFVFLVSPDSIAKGRYTLTELALAKRKWPDPTGRLWPVIVRPTDLSLLDPYLTAVTLLEPTGNVSAEAAEAIDAGSGGPSSPSSEILATSPAQRFGALQKYWQWPVLGTTGVVVLAVLANMIRTPPAPTLTTPSETSAAPSNSPRPVPADYVLQLNGQPSVRGTRFTLDMGFIEAGKKADATLSVRLSSGNGYFTTGSQLVGDVAVEGPTGLATLADNQERQFVISVLAPSADQGAQTRELRLLTSNDGVPDQQPLVTLVKWTALPASKSVTADSGAKPSGRGGDSSAPYEVCATAPAPGDYVVQPESVKLWLTGDRACNAWSTCTGRNDGNRFCLTFTLQGHNECLGVLSNCDPVRNSEGHVQAVFTLRRSPPTLTAS